MDNQEISIFLTPNTQKKMNNIKLSISQGKHSSASIRISIRESSHSIKRNIDFPTGKPDRK